MTTSVLPPKNQVEALLFASGRSMSVESLATLTGLSPDVARRACKTLAKELDDRGSALMLYEVDGGWKMTAREAYTTLVKAIVADAELSRACMETLAVIAYKHPNAIQSEVIDTRGSGAYDHIAELERLGFVAKVPFSRSFKLKLTEKFFTYFDVKGGEAEMRKVFENIKLPDPTVQQTLGDLSVVAVEPAPERKDGLEVVGVPEGGTPVPEPEDAPASGEEDAARKSEDNADERAAHRKFLDDLDARIEELSSRNDAHAQDPMLQRRPLPGVEEPIAESAPEQVPEGEVPAAEPAPEPVVEEKPKKRRKKADPSS